MNKSSARLLGIPEYTHNRVSLKNVVSVFRNLLQMINNGSENQAIPYGLGRVALNPKHQLQILDPP